MSGNFQDKLAGPSGLSQGARGMAAALRYGAAVVRCPSGALDLTLPDRCAWLLSPDTVARLAVARLLPPDLARGGAVALR